MNHDGTKRIAYTGLFAAMIFVTTWALHIPIGFSGGYIHFGDAIIYIAATLLPMPCAAAAAAIGAGLSDLLSPGGAVWLPATILIKPLCCLVFTRTGARMLCRRNILALFAAGLVTVFGYFLATAIITGSVAVAVAELPLSAIQPLGSAVCFLVWGVAVDKSNVKKALPAFLRGEHK